MTWLATHEAIHGLVGSAIGLALWRSTGNRRLFVVAVLWSWLIDVDHLVD